MSIKTDDVRIRNIQTLVAPSTLIEELPLNDKAAEVVATARKQAEAILDGTDDRVLVVVGPCSIHDPKAAMEYAEQLSAMKEKYKNDLVIIMRVYFEKPRTTVGWKGLINDPNLDGSFDINKGLHTARRLLLDLNTQGMPAATEFLDVISPQYVADLISWGAIGARTTESQVHRELASGLSMPVGFKNGTRGTVKIAYDAIQSAQGAHHFLSVTKNGNSAIVSTTGNDTCHVILRGATDSTNYEKKDVDAVAAELKERGLHEQVMIDCSHGNSNKDYRNQPKVVAELCSQLAQGSKAVAAVMIESNLVEGNQKLTDDLSALTYGLSVTDQCIDMETTSQVLEDLAAGVRTRRALA